MSQDFKDITIERDSQFKKFRINLVTAQDCVWVVSQCDTFAVLRDRKTQREVQDILFRSCQYIKDVDGKEVAVDLYDPAKGFLLPDMRKDSVTVDELFQEALTFNLGPISQRRKEKEAKRKAEEDAARAAAAS